MKLLGIGILRYNPDINEPVILTQSCELSSFGFYQRSTMREMIIFYNKVIAKRTSPGQQQSVRSEGFVNHVYMRDDGLCGCLTSDDEYPPTMAYLILSKILEDFESLYSTWNEENRNEAIVWPKLDEYLVKYQDPLNSDHMKKLQRDLDDNREMLHNEIDSILQRGERLEDFIEKLELSSPKLQAKKTNSFCVIV